MRDEKEFFCECIRQHEKSMYGKWQLVSFWMPAEDEDSIASIRARFPSDIAAIALGEIDSDIPAALNMQCYEAALQYYTTLTDLPPAKAFTPADVEYTRKTLTVGEDTMTYDERLAWVQAETTDTNPISLRQYQEDNGCIAFLGQWVGTPHVGQYVLNLRFSDGTLAYLPMPDENTVSPALPDDMMFMGEKFVYEKTFPTEEVTNEGETLIHLKGTYHYEVDIASKTVSLTVLQ